MKVLDGSHERAMLAWANSWISDRLDRMSKRGDSPNYECGGSCGSAKGAQQLTFLYGCAAIKRHVRFTGIFLPQKIRDCLLGALSRISIYVEQQAKVRARTRPWQLPQ